MDNSSQPAHPTTIWNKDFLLLWQGQLASQVGQRAFALAMVFFIKESTGSASLMGLMVLLSSLPGVLMGPMGGTIADNYSRKKLIVYGDLVNGLFVLALAAMMFFKPDATPLLIGGLFISAMVSSIIFSFFTPAVNASIPDIVPENKLDLANSMNQFALFTSLFIGQGLGGLLFTITGAPALFLINGLTYIFASGSETFINIPQEVPAKGKKSSQTFRLFISDTVDGMRFVWKQKGMRILFLATAMLHLFVAPMAILLPFYVEDYLKLDAAWYGYLLMALGTGSVIGYVIAGSLNIRSKAQCYMIILSLACASILLVLVGFLTLPVAVMAVIFLIGLVAGIFIVKVTTILQLSTTSEIRGRVFGLLATLTNGMAPTGMALGGIIADLTNKNMPAIFTGCGLLILALSVFIAFSREARDFLSVDVSHSIQS